MLIAAVLILGVCLVAAAFAKNQLYSSGLFALGAFLFILFMLIGCHHILQGPSNIQ